MYPSWTKTSLNRVRVQGSQSGEMPPSGHCGTDVISPVFEMLHLIKSWSLVCPPCESLSQFTLDNDQEWNSHFLCPLWF